MLCREGSALCVHGPAGSARTEGSLKNRDIEVRGGAAAGALVGTSLNILISHAPARSYCHYCYDPRRLTFLPLFYYLTILHVIFSCVSVYNNAA